MQIKNVNTNKLHDQLISAGLIPAKVEHDKKEGDIIAENTWITFVEGTDMNLVQQIIDSHDPTPIPTQPSEIEILRMEQAKTNAELIDLMMMMIGYGGGM